ncbi:MAG: potassium channel family protein, partial [Humidesulfovibrio sp.]|nr:potassium channel family protein [Humidesulfovibrio sp.]
MQLDVGQKRVLAALGVLGAVLLAGTMALMRVEGLSFADALYFSVVTMSTVGYGDVVPHTGAGRVVAGIMILTGVGSFMSAVAATSEHLLTRRAQKERREKLNMVIGVFFSEAGTRLLRTFALLDADLEGLRARLPEADGWSDQCFRKYAVPISEHGYKVAAKAADLED